MGATMNFGGRPLGPLRPAFTLCREPLVTTIWTKYTTRHARGYRKVVRVSRKSPAKTTRIRVEWRVSISDWAGGKGSTVKQFAPFDGQNGWSATAVNGFLDALTTKWRVRAQVPPDRGLTAKFQKGLAMSWDPSNAHLDKASSNGPY